MLQRVSGRSVADYLADSGDLGYRPSLLDKQSGAERPYPSVGALLDEWGNDDELHDVLLLPGAALSPASGRA